MHGQMGGERDFLYGRYGKLLATAAGTIGLSNYSQNLEFMLSQEIFERRDSKLGRAAKEEPHDSELPSWNKGFRK